MSKASQIYTTTTGAMHHAMVETHDRFGLSVNISCGLGNNNNSPTKNAHRLSNGDASQVTCTKCQAHPFCPNLVPWKGGAK
jgi:hypothetical protein